MRLMYVLLLPLLIVPMTAFANCKAVKASKEVMERMHHGMNIAYTGNADVDFVVGMIPHHQGAVDMAKIQLQYGTDPKMLALAQRIIDWQEYEIGFMSSWIRGRVGNEKNPDADRVQSVIAYKEAMEKMHHGMMVPYTGNADVDFATGMIPHHQGAIDMAWILKEHGSAMGLRDFADDIIRSQGQEIRIMQNWLDNNKEKMATDVKHSSH
jgi:uncharacterized protein (DUF305 family)